MKRNRPKERKRYATDTKHQLNKSFACLFVGNDLELVYRIYNIKAPERKT